MFQAGWVPAALFSKCTMNEIAQQKEAGAGAGLLFHQVRQND
jgi:hypothetical protein